MITDAELVVEDVSNILSIFLFFSKDFTIGIMLVISPILAPWNQINLPLSLFSKRFLQILFYAELKNDWEIPAINHECIIRD